MSLKKQYSVQLYTKDFKESNSWRSSFYVIYYGNTPQQTYIEPFPEILKSKSERMDFISALMDTLKQKRIKENEKKRKQRQLKKEAKERKLSVDEEEYYKLLEKEFDRQIEEYIEDQEPLPEIFEEIIEEDDEQIYLDLLEAEFADDIEEVPRRFDINVTQKSARGAFKNADYDFRHTILAYDTPQPVNPNNKAQLDDLFNNIREDFDKVIDTAFEYDGERRWIVKLLTPFYDHNGNIMYSDYIEEKDEDGNKTGRKYYAPTSYSYGFSIGRTLRMGKKKTLKEELDFVLSSWGEALDRYNAITSKIELSGILLEEII